MYNYVGIACQGINFCRTTENEVNTDSYGVEMDLETLLQSSFPNPGDKDKIRQLFIEDVQNNVLGVNSHYVGVEILFTYPTSMTIAQKA
jgi:hypothetical protein